MALGVEVGGIEPCFKGLLAGRPFVVEHGEPGGVAVAAFDDHVLAENSLKREAEALRGAT